MKAAAECASRAGHSVRAAERWLAGTREMSAEALIALITSDIGHEILEALIDDLPRNQRATFWARVSRMARRKVLDERIRFLEDQREAEQLDMLGPVSLRHTTTR